jgi:hypothetical protein
VMKDNTAETPLQQCSFCNVVFHHSQLQGHGCCKLRCVAQRGNIFWIVADWRRASSIHFFFFSLVLADWRCTIGAQISSVRMHSSPGAVHLPTPKKCARILLFYDVMVVIFRAQKMHRCTALPPPVSTIPRASGPFSAIDWAQTVQSGATSAKW